MANYDTHFEGRDDAFIDIDRMVNEGLGGGLVTQDNGKVDEFPDIAQETPPQNTQKKNSEPIQSEPKNKTNH